MMDKAALLQRFVLAARKAGWPQSMIDEGVGWARDLMPAFIPTKSGSKGFNKSARWFRAFHEYARNLGWQGGDIDKAVAWFDFAHPDWETAR